MNWKRRLKGNVRLQYCKWQAWNTFKIDKYWSGCLLYFEFSKFVFILDCRINWLEDMVTGTPR